MTPNKRGREARGSQKQKTKSEKRQSGNGQKATATLASGAPNGNSCIIVAVGASAGGLEALTELLKPLPRNPGMAFVVIPHLAPQHKSAMTELLGRHTNMPVRQVFDGMSVEGDSVYVIPPDRSMRIKRGILRLAQRQVHDGPPLPIDTFFRSLAEDCGKNAIAVVLSGSASDGTLGVAAIKHEGGLTFAQDPRTAKYDGMPRSAIAAGFIDFILPPADIARELMRIRTHPYLAHPEPAQPERAQLEPTQPGPAQPSLATEEAESPTSEMRQIFALLRQVRKVDFSEYKRATVRRRILRRMALNHVQSVADYAAMLQRNHAELEALHHDILINVTSFFRDPEAFEALHHIVYPAILQAHGPSETIRIWVPGCSTGEEVYSHAIALVEYMSNVQADISLQIFGTDLSEVAVRTARAGVYKEHIAADVSPQRLRRFFNKVEHGYEISKSIRDKCIFAIQNVFYDPPFSRVDLVSCRNVLIYLSQSLQRRVVPIFHYALNSTGFLMVGNMEGIVGARAGLFEPADRKHKIYRKCAVSAHALLGPSSDRFETHEQAATPNHEEPAKAVIDLQREADRLLLTKYVPAAVVVNEQLEILQIRGHAGRYLELPSGKATLNLLKMAKVGLLSELQRGVEEARESAALVRCENVQFEIDGAFASVNMEVVPFQVPFARSAHFIIVFEEGKPLHRPEPPMQPVLPPSEQDQQISQLRQELTATKEYLQSIIEALEANNEELQSASEEIQSGNEELQSTNEELQTSKEELESSNEELNTVNDEIQDRNRQLMQANNDLLNLLSSVDIPIVMLDGDLRIRRVTPQAEAVLGILSADIGSSLRHLRLKLNVPELPREILGVIETLKPRELPVPDGQNHGYRLRITPYRTMDNRIEGAVLVFVAASMAKSLSDGEASGARKQRRGRAEATAD
jgi:two-component system CheB/CheR fusion protein